MNGPRAKTFIYLFTLGWMMPANFATLWAALGAGVLIVIIAHLVEIVIGPSTPAQRP